MRSLIAAEMLKLRTARMLAVCLGVVALIAAALPIFSGAVAGHRGEPALTPSSLADFLRAPAHSLVERFSWSGCSPPPGNSGTARSSPPGSRSPTRLGC
ncbi:MAG TPA: hypothetical protein VGJ59_20715 [Jatrophihabitantaceae bacterium]|jgi:hypothetical protein